MSVPWAPCQESNHHIPWEAPYQPSPEGVKKGICKLLLNLSHLRGGNEMLTL